MLREIPAKQLQGEPARRWFTSPEIDLYVWLGEDGSPTGFQLCYDKQAREHALTWTQASGRGRLHAFGIGAQSFNKAFKMPPPHVLALIELEEGPRMMSNLVNVTADPKHVKCDMPVEVVFHKLTDDLTVPLFQPAGKGGA